MMSRSYGLWQTPIQQPAAPQPPPEDPMGFANPRSQLFPPMAGVAGHGRIPNWKGKNKGKPLLPTGSEAGYRPPTLNELQYQNRLKARRFYPNKNKKFSRFAPYAPRNTTSFLIRAKKAGGIASLVSPCPVTPAILPTPKFSPSRERLVDMAKEEWGVDGYGSMTGLIRLRSPTGEEDDDDVDAEDGSSDSDVEERVEVERRLDHDLSRFEMVYHPNFVEESNQQNGHSLENRVDDQDTQIALLKEENLILKERLFLIEREMAEMRSRLQMSENGFRARAEEDNNDNANKEASDNEGGVGDLCEEEKSTGTENT